MQADLITRDIMHRLGMCVPLIHFVYIVNSFFFFVPSIQRILGRAGQCRRVQVIKSSYDCLGCEDPFPEDLVPGDLFPEQKIYYQEVRSQEMCSQDYKRLQDFHQYLI